ncbi:hypothetical protein SCALM49S_08980 [Streptomyces californicus]
MYSVPAVVPSVTKTTAPKTSASPTHNALHSPASLKPMTCALRWARRSTARETTTVTANTIRPHRYVHAQTSRSGTSECDPAVATAPAEDHRGRPRSRRAGCPVDAVTTVSMAGRAGPPSADTRPVCYRPIRGRYRPARLFRLPGRKHGSRTLGAYPAPVVRDLGRWETRAVLSTRKGPDTRDGTAEGGTPPPASPAAREQGRGQGDERGRGPGRGRGPRRADRLLVAAAVCCAVPMALQGWIPNTGVNAGSLVQTLLPWTGLAVPVLLVLAAVRRSRAAAAAVLVPAVVWGTLFGGALTDKRSAGGDLTVVSHNVGEANPDPAGTARVLAGADADVLALEELSDTSAPVYARELAAAYPHHAVIGGVGIWSRHPLADVRAVPIMPWTRALRATAKTPEGPVAVYAVHLASVRVSAAGFTTGRRNDAARGAGRRAPGGGRAPGRGAGRPQRDVPGRRARPGDLAAAVRATGGGRRPRLHLARGVSRGPHR